MKSLDLTKAKAGQTIYYINDNMFRSNNIKMWIEQVVVTNDPVPPMGVQPIWNGKVSRHSLALLAKNMKTNRLPYLKATRKQAERAMEYMMRPLGKHIKPEEGGKCPLGCEDSKLEYTSYECVCNFDNAPCWHCENAMLECNQCGDEFVEE